MLKDILLFFVGIMAGSMNAIAGGGLLLGFPAMLAAGLSPLAANITGNIIVMPGQLSSIYGYRKHLRQVPKRYALLLIPCFVGGTIGALTLRFTPSDQFQKIVPGLILFAVVLFAFQPFLHIRLHRQIHAKTKQQKSLVPFALAIMPMALYGGYFGAGFGFMMLAFLGFTKLHEIHQMNALKNMAGLTIAFVSTLSLYSTHLINWHVGLVMASGNFVGGYLGARAALRVSSHAIRIVVIAIGVITVIYLAIHSFN
jgi:uncharacterized membrane protein YfcA